MKIKTKVTEEREFDIELPFFRKDPESSCIKYLAVLDEKTVIYLFDSDERTSLSVDIIDRNIRDISDAYNKWAIVSEEEFLQAHETALKNLSLRPVLCEIDREIEAELNNPLLSSLGKGIMMTQTYEGYFYTPSLFKTQN
jgi:hypothetical protein